MEKIVFLGRMSAVKHLHVTCGVIERNSLVLAVQRSATMSLPLKWEFPGGKVNRNESYEDCLRRELLEELGLHIRIRQRLEPSTHQYPMFLITLYPFICLIEAGEPELREHAALCWLSPSELGTLDWAAADIPVLESYCRAVQSANYGSRRYD
jgi:8-oxo-dGTP diphosphatase